MKFRTEIEIKPWSQPIEYDHNIVCLGSCFATNIAERLLCRKFRVTASPTGILFNPLSILNSIEQMTSGYRCIQDNLIESNGRYVSLNFHSSISGITPEEAIVTMNNALERGANSLKSADITIITLGTAWAYRHKASGEVVANCHKLPASEFSRELLSVEQTIETLRKIVELLHNRVLFTLSPVRHIGEGMEDNSISKAILRVAIDQVCKLFPERASYFPSYEIMMDDLRDYRFYGEDMAHPTSQAVDYIADKFFEAALSAEAKSQMSRVCRIVAAAKHRPSNPHSDAHQRFCRGMILEIESIKGIDFDEELEHFRRTLQINL